MDLKSIFTPILIQPLTNGLILFYNISKASRIAPYELTMLSADVLGYVEERSLNPGFEEWGEWIEENRAIVAEKPWYELTVSDVVYRAGR